MQAYLNTRQRAAVEKYFIAKCISDRLDSGEFIRVAHRGALNDVMKRCTNEESKTFLSSASPFFWLNARRLIECGKEDTPDQAITTLLELAPDSIKDWRSLSNSYCQLVRVVSDDDCQFLIYEPTSKLVSSSHIQQCAPEERMVPPFNQVLREAIKLVLLCDPNLGRDLVESVKFFVPINSPNVEMHRSFTDRRQGEVIFLSQASDELRLAEALVHEHAHIRLNIATWYDAIVDGDDPPIHYSPWRHDPRPMHGLIHAIFVFAEILPFLKMCLQLSESGKEQSRIVRRIQLAEERLWVAIHQVKNPRLTKSGRQAWHYIQSKLQLLGITDTETRSISQRTLREMQDWLSSNPTLKIEGLAQVR